MSDNQSLLETTRQQLKTFQALCKSISSLVPDRSGSDSPGQDTRNHAFILCKRFHLFRESCSEEAVEMLTNLLPTQANQQQQEAATNLQYAVRQICQIRWDTLLQILEHGENVTPQNLAASMGILIDRENFISAAYRNFIRSDTERDMLGSLNAQYDRQVAQFIQCQSMR